MTKYILPTFLFLALCAVSCGGCSLVQTDDTEIRSEALTQALRAIEEQIAGIPEVGGVHDALPEAERTEFLSLTNQLWELARADETVEASILLPLVTRQEALHKLALANLDLDPPVEEFLGMVTTELLATVTVANQGN